MTEITDGRPYIPIGTTRSASMVVKDSHIHQFADQTGDANPIHVDPVRAQESLFGERVAHGMLSAGIISTALAYFPGEVVLDEQTLRYQRPVYPGDEVTAYAVISDSTPIDRTVARYDVTVDVRVDGPDRDVVVITSDNTVIIDTDPGYDSSVAEDVEVV